ncbi:MULTISPECIES: hypothetical protein [unclassified Streptomyces]|uniref:hypothetical protein n=1 Tax=unclassified Streptomyces TaxID=2593676 RepID=UPI0036E37600
MSDHLSDDVLACLARAGALAPHRGGHLADCSDCRTRLAVWQDITCAVRAEAAEEAVPVPSFDGLLGALPTAVGPVSTSGGPPAVPVAVHGRSARVGSGSLRIPPARPGPAANGGRRAAPGLARPWRTAWQLARGQALLMPGLWAPLSAIFLVAAALVASAQVHERLGVRLFGASVVLLVLFGALIVASPRRDPRRELLFTLPVPPAAVFLARLAVVLCVDLALAMICSVLVQGPGWWAVVASWLGESLLAASLALALSVRFSPPVGAAAGGTLWFLGVVGGPHGLFSTPVDAFLDVILATTPWTIASAAVLLAWAARAMRSYREPAPS